MRWWNSSVIKKKKIDPVPGWDCSGHVNRHSLWATLHFSYYDLICHRAQSSFSAKAPTHTFLVNLIKRIRLCHQDQITGMWGALTSRGRLETYTSTEAAPGETFVSWVISRISCMTQPIHKKTLSFVQALPSTLPHAEMCTFTRGLTSSPHHFLSHDWPANSQNMMKILLRFV